MAKIKPQLPGGFRDYLPEKEAQRRFMIDKITGTFERFGFLPTDTPAVEKKEILTGGDSGFNKEIFTLERGEGKENLALRFDLTVPLARLVSAYPDEIQKPFRRYQIGSTWRGEKPQRGRYREFLQCDIDIVGTSSPEADAEILAVMAETMNSLGLGNFLIKINNRKILNGIAENIGLNFKLKNEVFRTLDKIDKEGKKNVLTTLKNSIDLDKKSITALEDFISISEGFDKTRGNESLKVFEGIGKISGENKTAEEGISELKKITELLDSLGVSENHWKIDPLIVRGLGYYTGPVFETVLVGNEDIGSIFSGGRYDGLIENFSGFKTPAVGASLGIDRLFTAVTETGAGGNIVYGPEVMVLNFSADCRNSVLRLATQLRRSNIKTDIYIGGENTMKGQLSHAARTGVPVVCIIGPEEKRKGTVQVKYMEKREQQEFNRDEFLSNIQELFGV